MNEKMITMSLSEYELFQAERESNESNIKNNMVCSEYVTIGMGHYHKQIEWFDPGERLNDKSKEIKILKEEIQNVKSMSVKEFKRWRL